MQDNTKELRRERISEIAEQTTDDRAEVEARHGQVWTTDELGKDFTVMGFLTPYVIVRRKDTRESARWSSSIIQGTTSAGSMIRTDNE
jgi:hypothetical protein